MIVVIGLPDDTEYRLVPLGPVTRTDMAALWSAKTDVAAGTTMVASAVAPDVKPTAEHCKAPLVTVPTVSGVLNGVSLVLAPALISAAATSLSAADGLPLDVPGAEVKVPGSGGVVAPGAAVAVPKSAKLFDAIVATSITALAGTRPLPAGGETTRRYRPELGRVSMMQRPSTVDGHRIGHCADLRTSDGRHRHNAASAHGGGSSRTVSVWRWLRIGASSELRRSVDSDSHTIGDGRRTKGQGAVGATQNGRGEQSSSERAFAEPR